MPREKDQSIETLRGLAIILVVAFHVIGSDPTDGIRVADDSLYRYFQFSFRYLRMPLFTVISGFVYAMRPVQAGKVAGFLRGKARRILLPLVSVSTLQFLAKQLSQGVGDSAALGSLWRIYFYPFDQFWFLQAVFLIFLTVTVLDRAEGMKTLSRWALCLLGAILLCLFTPRMTLFFSFPGYLNLLPFFILGYGLNRFGSKLAARPVVLAALACLACGIIFEQISWFRYGDRAIVAGEVAAMVPLLCVGIPGTFLLANFRTTVRPLAWVGGWAYSIYLFHVFAIGGSGLILDGLGVEGRSIQLLTRLLAGLGFPILVEAVASASGPLRWLLLGLRGAGDARDPCPLEKDPMKQSKRLKTSGSLVAVWLAACASLTAAGAEPPDKPAAVEVFRLWTMGCAHVGSDLRRADRESLADAIRQSEQGGSEGGPSFDWDLAIHVGDISGAQEMPDDEEGRQLVRQFAAARKHRREDFYNLAGNHDASRSGEPTMAWFRKWVDPTGEHTETSGVDPRRRYAVEGTWERYCFRAGNLLFLMMSDRNDLPPPIGRGERGGFPAGAVTAETFDWWKKMVEENRDAIIISAHHHMLKETTVKSGPWEGMTKRADGSWRSGVHGYFPEGAPQGASYLYFVGDKPDAQAFENYLAEHPGAIDLWIGGHTHTDPDDVTAGRSHVERRWGVTFLNTAALTRHHGGKVPMSRLLTFTDGSRRLRIQCYLHTSEHAPQGWYDKVERIVELGKPARLP